MSNYGEDETPSADMTTDRPLHPEAYRWTTYAERLQAAGVSWKVYQEYDNFGDNLLSVFPAFRPCPPHSELYRRGRAWAGEGSAGGDRTRSDGEQLVDAFRRDLAAGTLPQVSWVVTAAKLSEHPDAEPARGEHVCARLLEALVDHPEMFARTAFIVNYDEVGGFFDHMPPPVPPIGDYRGFSTVALDGEAKDYAGEADDARIRHAGRHPIGLGARVPAIVVSPWSRGGFVCSELFDHTSVIRLIERRFGVREPNISPWRRAVCGDLTSAFDFSRAAGLAGKLPSTTDFAERIARSAAGSAVAIPTEQQPIAQMSGQRAHRPLPYAIVVDGRRMADGRLGLQLVNRGATGATFTVHDNHDGELPWHFTIGAGESHDAVLTTPGDAYDLTLRGPNGLLQRYAGTHGAHAPAVEAFLRHLPREDAVELALANGGNLSLEISIRMAEPYGVSGSRERRLTVAPGVTVRQRWTTAASDNWYELVVLLESDPGFVRSFAGKVETGRASRTDPAIGAMRLTV